MPEVFRMRGNEGSFRPIEKHAHLVEAVQEGQRRLQSAEGLDERQRRPYTRHGVCGHSNALTLPEVGPHYPQTRLGKLYPRTSSSTGPACTLQVEKQQSQNGFCFVLFCSKGTISNGQEVHSVVKVHGTDSIKVQELKQRTVR